MIRKTNANDLNAIVDLWVELSQFHEMVDDSFTLKSNTREQYQSYAKSFIEDDEKLSIVFEEHQVLGYLFAEIKKHPPIFKEDTIGFISEICVTKNCRRMGVGQKLLEFSEKWFRDQGITRMECFVASQNLISNSFWKKHGCVEYLKTYKKHL